MMAGGNGQKIALRASTGQKSLLLRQSERDFQAAVVRLATVCHWRVWHDRATNAPRRCTACGEVRRLPRNDAGFLDLVLVRRPRVLFVELKAEDGTPTDAQQAWLDDLRACGQDARIWRPADWPEIQETLL